MTNLPPVEYLDEAAKVAGYSSFAMVGSPRNLSRIIAHARALHELAQAHAEIAALKPRETLEDVAKREAEMATYVPLYQTHFAKGFLRAAEMAKKGELPDE